MEAAPLFVRSSIQIFDPSYTINCTVASRIKEENPFEMSSSEGSESDQKVTGKRIAMRTNILILFDS